MPDALALRPDDPAELCGHRIIGRLGEGSQGVVYLGLAPSGDRVAIKVLRARMAEDPGAHERFVRELSAAKKVARFCTAQVLAAGIDDDRPYIVSEYVEGRSLRSHILEQGPRTAGALERLAIGTLTALAAIHRAGIVHRDFTPHNVLLGPDGPRVIDFGIARALGAAGNAETNSVGTPSYMAPEQVAGGEIGPPADMFAWGSTILFAGTGHPPFGNESMHAVMDRIMHAEPDVSALEEPLRAVVTACLSKDPAKRPTAQQAQAQLLGEEAAEALMPPPAFGAAQPRPSSRSGQDGQAGQGSRGVRGGQADPGDRPGPDRQAEPSDQPEPGGQQGRDGQAEPSDRPGPGGQQGRDGQADPSDQPGPGGRSGQDGQGRSDHQPRQDGQPAAVPPPPKPVVEFPFPLALPVGGTGSGRAGGSPAGLGRGAVLTPASGSVLRSGAGRRRRAKWIVLAGAAVVVGGLAVAVPLWPGGGDASTGPKTHTAAEVPATPMPTPASVAPTTPEPQLNGVRSGIPKPKATHKSHWKCRDYQHVYTMIGTGTVFLKVSVCRDVFSGTAVLADSAPKDGRDVCLQLRGHLTGLTGSAAYLSTVPMTSKGGHVHSFQNGPTVKFGPTTAKTEDSVAVNTGSCRSSGANVQTSWQDQEQLATG